MIQQMLLGGGTPNVLTNGNFSSTIGWVRGAGWTISSGKAHCAGAGSLTQDVGSVEAGTFRVTYTISNHSGAGGVYVALDDTTGTSRTANGTYTEDLVRATRFEEVTVNPTTGTVVFDLDNISVARVG